MTAAGPDRRNAGAADVGHAAAEGIHLLGRPARDHLGPHVQVAFTSGGTDIVSGFAGGAPTVPVWPGEISAPLLGR